MKLPLGMSATAIWSILDGTTNIGAAYMAKHPRTWLVRAGKNATFIDDFRANSHVAIGWHETGPIPPTASDEFLTDLFDRTFTSAKPGSRRVWQAQVRRFLTEMRPGDRVATSRSQRPRLSPRHC